MNKFKIAFLIYILIPLFAFGRDRIAVKKILHLMGSRFEITAISENNALATEAVNAAVDEIGRIEKLISSWDAQSETGLINRNAGIRPVNVSDELFGIIQRSIKVSALTGGAFDISFASAEKIWDFDKHVHPMPAAETITASVANINYKNIIVNPADQSVFLKNKGMKIGFGAIGKGYAANRAKKIMLAIGITSGIVNAGGDLIVWGKNENSQDWRIGIADPSQKKNIFSWLSVKGGAVVTSGNYEKYFLSGGQRYAHIINPHTGYPVTGLKSVTIVCPDAELADALATAVFVMGEKKGLALLNQLNGIEGLIINDKNEITTSESLTVNYYKQDDTESVQITGSR